MLGDDPRPWLLASEEPAARWVALTHLLGRPDDDPDVVAAHASVLDDESTQKLLTNLPVWGSDNPFGGHNSPAFAPNSLNLLADMGVRAGDDARIEALLDQLLSHQETDGRFAAYGKAPTVEEASWGAVLCDTHAIVEVLVRFGRGDDSRVAAATKRMADDLADTAQGRAWPCVPHTTSGWRGPGRKDDFCPQVTLEALRTFARLPRPGRPDWLADVARVSLRAWRVRAQERPYIFGHGRRFKAVKWPANWYDVHWVLDTLGRYPELWNGADATAADRLALAELAACMVAYNFGPNGRVTPRSCYRGFSDFSFGQKKQPSPFATARLAAVLRRLDDLADEIAAVDVLALGGSKGGTGTPMPPNA